jgi:hypothetical protein
MYAHVVELTMNHVECLYKMLNGFDVYDHNIMAGNALWKYSYAFSCERKMISMHGNRYWWLKARNWRIVKHVVTSLKPMYVIVRGVWALSLEWHTLI